MAISTLCGRIFLKTWIIGSMRYSYKSRRGHYYTQHYFFVLGMRAAKGIYPSELQPMRMPYVYHLMPHLLADPYSLRPAYHLKGNRSFVEVILGVPTVKRDKESYLMITLTVSI